MNSQTISEMLAWEEGVLGECDEILLFQELVNSNVIEHLEESYHENARLLSRAGLIENYNVESKIA